MWIISSRIQVPCSGSRLIFVIVIRTSGCGHVCCIVNYLVELMTVACAHNEVSLGSVACVHDVGEADCLMPPCTLPLGWALRQLTVKYALN